MKNKKAKYIQILSVLLSLFFLESQAFTAGRIQNEDVKSLSEIQAAVLTTTGNISNGSNQLTSLAATVGLSSGQFIYGTGIPSGTTISSISGSTVTMSANATATTSGVTVTFGGQMSQLINDTKLYVSALGLNEQLSTAITNGDLGNSGFLKQPYELSTIGLNTSVAANALTIALKKSDGTTDPSSGTPVKIGFRSATVTSGGFNQRSAIAATSLVVPSGATLGTVSGLNSFLYFYAIDNTGTIELAVSSLIYEEGSVVNTTTISAGATSSTTLYSTTGRTGVPIRLIGRALVNEATAGTWATAPTELSLFPFRDATSVAARYFATGGQSIPSTTDTIVMFTTKSFDNTSSYNTGTGVFTVPVSGKYRVTSTLIFPAANWSAGDAVSLRVFKNGVYYGTLGFFQFNATVTGQSAPASGSDDIDCVVGDTIDIRINQTNAASRSTGTDIRDNHVSFARVGN